ncbi:MAG: pilus assembly protein [Jatrophihabitans sp.]|nr:MAG: pilus assembly protein [Jatrophihabitans sp.]
MRRSDRGAGVVEFVLISVLLVLLLFGLLQVGLWFYVRSVAASAAADAARYAATRSGDLQSVADRARQLVIQGSSTSIANELPCTASSGSASGLPTVTVRCSGELKMLLIPFDIPVRLSVQSSTLLEDSAGS